MVDRQFYRLRTKKKRKKKCAYSRSKEKYLFRLALFRHKDIDIKRWMSELSTPVDEARTISQSFEQRGEGRGVYVYRWMVTNRGSLVVETISRRKGRRDRSSCFYQRVYILPEGGREETEGRETRGTELGGC